MAPPRKHSGSLAVPHASFVPEPKSPSHGAQVEVAGSQTGVAPAHAALLVHCTQVLVVVLQTGVAPEHWESMMHPAQVPAVGPVVAQIPDRHTAAPSAPVHGPSPLA